MIIFLGNQFIGREIATGGDILFVEILRRCEQQAIVIAPVQIHDSIRRYAPKAVLITSDSQNLDNSSSTLWGGLITVLRYFRRSWRTYAWLKQNLDSETVIYLTGDFICNTLPIVMLGPGRKKYRRICANFFHRNQVPADRRGNPYLVSLGSRMLQGLSLLIIRRFADCIFVLSELGKTELMKMGFDGGNIVISGAGVNREIFSYRTDQRISNRIIYLGRLNITKGAFDLVEALHLLAQDCPDFECIFVGHGSEDDKNLILSLAEKYGLLEKISIKGYVEEQEKYRLLASSRLLAFSSKEEGYGIAILEALFLNVDVVCYELPALVAIFGHCKGIHFVSQHDLNGFSREMRRVLCVSDLEGRASADMLKGLQTWEDVFEIQSKWLN